MTTNFWIIIAGALIVAIALGLLFYRQRRSRQLRTQFGPEYDHAVREYGSSLKAEHELQVRQKRIQKLHIHSLPPQDRIRFAEAWHSVQSRFVDAPAESIESADQLVCELMLSRGYPMSDFEGRAQDLSVDHAVVVRNYRAAHAIALRRGASTEDLRQALVYYRDLFDELLEAHTAERMDVR